MYLYIDRSLRTLTDPKKYPPISIDEYIYNYWVELWYQLGEFYLYPLKFFNLSRNIKQSEYAVLLLHGYGRTQTDWQWMRKQIKNLPIFLVNLKPSFATIEDIAAQSIPDKMKDIQQKTNCKKIILIGHSMGGLVASYYSENLDEQNLITDVITIGSPFYGTKISVAGFGENAKEMCPETRFLADLRKKVEASSKTYFQISTQFENLLFPWHSSLLESTPKERQFILQLTPHLSMLHSKEIATKLNEWLAQSCK